MFSDEERDNIYKVTAICMHLANLKFKQRQEQAEFDEASTETGNSIADLLGTDAELMYTNFCKPKIKVGAELLTKGQTAEKTMDTVGALCKGLFDRNFTFLVKKCNVTLETGLKRSSFIGVLDIAGFEIFDYNGFEQICINFCNEKLQQFFNHHMFVLEQEEYKKEGINWVFVDFGMDLQACIELFEKKLGLLAILEEESMFPKATDKTFQEKLNANCLGKSPAFIKPKPPKGNQVEGHFAICHYAGTVTYNLTGWLEKNKDPLNDTVVDLLKKGTNSLIVTVFEDHPGQTGDAGGGKGKGKSGGFKTVSSGYRDQLQNLMRTLNATHPHFIRCIVPNETKTPGKCDAGLIMLQLTCNGVLEGIRICRKGFPNRMMYPDFKNRYKILASVEMSEAKDDKSAAKACFDKAGLDAETYRTGNTKVFFRAGVLGELEEIRDGRVQILMTWLQSWCRGFLSRKSYKKLQDQRVSLIVVQRNIRKYQVMKSWPWYGFWNALKPRLNVSRVQDQLDALEKKAVEAEGALDGTVAARKAAEAINVVLLEERNALLATVDASKGGVSELFEKQAKLQAQKAELEGQVAEVQLRLANEQEARNQIA